MLQKYFLFIGIVAAIVGSFVLRGLVVETAFSDIEKTAITKLQTMDKVSSDIFLSGVEIANSEGKMAPVFKPGSYMLVNLWSVRCQPCVDNLKTLKRVEDVMSGYGGKDWRVIAVSIDKPDDLQHLSSMIKFFDFGAMAGFYDAKKNLFNLFPVKGIPATFIVDDDGRILYVVYGPAPWLDPDVIDFLRSLQLIKDKRK